MRVFPSRPPEHLLFHVCRLFSLIIISLFPSKEVERIQKMPHSHCLLWKQKPKHTAQQSYTKKMSAKKKNNKTNNNKYFTFNKSFSISLLGSKSPLHLRPKKKRRKKKGFLSTPRALPPSTLKIQQI